MLQHKRLFAGMLAATMTLSLTACGSKTADKDAGGASLVWTPIGRLRRAARN